jgi:hypothetical protein
MFPYKPIDIIFFIISYLCGHFLFYTLLKFIAFDDLIHSLVKDIIGFLMIISAAFYSANFYSIFNLKKKMLYLISILLLIVLTWSLRVILGH